MPKEKIRELKKRLHKTINSGEADENTILAISRELDKYIVEYIKKKKGVE